MDPPHAIGPYRIFAVLGRGGAGTVYSGRAPNGEAVAVKVPALSTPDDLQRFQRECSLQRDLGGEGLVPLLDAGQSQQGPYAVFPLIEGGSLQDRLRHGPLPWREAVDVVRRVAEVAGRMHSAGVVHRDLKPANVLFSRDGQPWVADLGLSKHAGAADGLSKTGAFAGSAGFAAPEQAMDAKSAGPPADVFALGAILYTAITGQEPFASSSAAGVFKKSSLGEFTPLRSVVEEVPAWVAVAVTQALAPEPEDRPASGAAFAGLLNPEPARASVSTAQGTRQPRGAGTKNGLVAFLVTVAVVLAGAAGWLVLTGESKPEAQPPPARPDDPEPPPAPPTSAPPDPGPSDPDPPAQDPADDPPPNPARWSPLGGEVLLEAFGGHMAAVTKLRVEANGSRVLSGSVEGELRVWDASRGIPLGGWGAASLGPIGGVAFGPVGELQAITQDGELLVAPTPEDPLRRFASGHALAYDLDVGPRGDMVTAGADGWRYWTVEQTAVGGPPPPLRGRGSVRCVRFAPGGGGLALGERGSSWRFSTDGSVEDVTDRLGQAAFRDLCWSPDGGQVAVLSANGWVALHTWPELEPLARERAYRPATDSERTTTESLCFSGDGTRIFIAANTDPGLRARAVPGLEPDDGLTTTCRRGLLQVRAGPDGTLYTGGVECDVRAFDARGSRWPPRATRMLFYARQPNEKRTLRAVRQALTWLDERTVVLNGLYGLEAIDVTTRQRYLQSPASKPVLGLDKVLALNGRLFGLHEGQFTVGEIELSGAQLRCTQPLGRELVDPRTKSLQLEALDIDQAAGVLFILGRERGNTKGLTSLLRYSSEAPYPVVYLVTAPEWLGASPRFGQASPGVRALWFFGRFHAKGFQLSEEGEIVTQTPARVWEQPLYYVGQLNDRRVFIIRKDAVAWWRDPGTGKQTKFQLKEAVIEFYALRGERLLLRRPDKLDVYDPEAAEVISSFPLLEESIAGVLPSRTERAFYVWTVRGELLRFAY